MNTLQKSNNMTTSTIILVKLQSHHETSKNIPTAAFCFGIRLLQTPSVENNTTDDVRDNVLGDRRIHIDILTEKYKEISEKIDELLKEIEESEKLYHTLDENIDAISIKENISKSNRIRESYLKSLEYQASTIKVEIDRFNKHKVS